uniref:Uncharacterized protein n=1 Tax=Kalanchoe fedtschenkoi TaxID=63787 RepID=A0A7N0UJZ3_KALFE
MELNKRIESSRLVSCSYKVKPLRLRKRKMMRTGKQHNQRVEGRAMRMKLRTLQRLIPGGVELSETNSLFVHTADYIMLLRFKVSLLEALTSQIGNK